MHEWNKYITENIRHALMFNTYGKHPLRFEHTYKELGLYPYNKFIDVVGRNNPNDSIKESVVVEIKSGWSYHEDELPKLLGLINNRKALYEDIYKKIEKTDFRTDDSKNKRLEYYHNLIGIEEDKSAK